MRATVYYFGETIPARNFGKIAEQTTREFATIDEAKAASMPDDANFAYLPSPDEDGYYVRNRRDTHWDFFRKDDRGSDNR